MRPPVPDRQCEQCGEANTVLVEMEPGRDRAPWFLCVKDWAEGTKPTKCGRIPAKYQADYVPPDATK